MTERATSWKRARRWTRYDRQRRNLTARILMLCHWIEPIWPAGSVLALLLAVLFLLRHLYPSFGGIGQGVYIEAWGTLLDILLVGIILTFFTIRRDRRERIDRYLEEIDDFKKWDSEEARLRITGNIRRLARLGKTDIDFSGLKLRNVSFGNQDIEDLRGATFNLGLRLDKMSKNSTHLENVDFSHVDCRRVTFSRNTGDFSGLGLIGKNLSFVYANLNDACFDGAMLTWTDYEANSGDWYEDNGEDEDGRPMQHQVHYPAFSGANLTGCSFRYVKFEHADFREAKNILDADFTGADGLATCFFDEHVREHILTSEASSSSAG